MQKKQKMLRASKIVSLLLSLNIYKQAHISKIIVQILNDHSKRQNFHYPQRNLHDSAMMLPYDWKEVFLEGPSSPLTPELFYENSLLQPMPVDQ